MKIIKIRNRPERAKQIYMPQSLSKVYVHITFSTKNRQHLIDDDIKESHFEYLGGICKGLDCNPLKLGCRPFRAQLTAL
jgi:hypothetical protein